MNNLKRRLIVGVALASVLTVSGLGMTPANAITVTFDLSQNGAGSLGSPQNFVSSNPAYTITATAFQNVTASSWATENLYFKNGTGDENGLGIASNADHEIAGNHFIQLYVGAAEAAGLKAFFF